MDISSVMFFIKASRLGWKTKTGEIERSSSQMDMYNAFLQGYMDLPQGFKSQVETRLVCWLLEAKTIVTPVETSIRLSTKSRMIMWITQTKKFQLTDMLVGQHILNSWKSNKQSTVSRSQGMIGSDCLFKS